MGEKSEVQNLTEATPASELLDATPPAADAEQVQHGEPKNYPEDVRDADRDLYTGEDGSAS